MDAKRPKTAKDLRRISEESLESKIPEEVWTKLLNRGEVEQVLEGYLDWEEDFEDFLATVRDRLEYHVAGQNTIPRQQKRTVVKRIAKFIRRTYYVAPEDDQAIAIIVDRYGLSTHSDAVRLALRLVAESPVQLAKRKGKTG